MNYKYISRYVQISMMYLYLGETQKNWQLDFTLQNKLFRQKVYNILKPSGYLAPKTIN